MNLIDSYLTNQAELYFIFVNFLFCFHIELLLLVINIWFGEDCMQSAETKEVCTI